MRTKPVSLVPHCTECGAVWLPGDETRWRTYWVDDGPDDKLVFYCPRCCTAPSKPHPVPLRALPLGERSGEDGVGKNEKPSFDRDVCSVCGGEIFAHNRRCKKCGTEASS
jgi:hypothetical protein